MSDEEMKMKLCTMPKVPERRFPLGFDPVIGRLIIAIQLKWVKGTVLPYCFLSQPPEFVGGEEEKKIVREGFDVWKNLGIDIKFEEVQNPDEAKIKIGFLPEDGYWSYIGTEITKTHYRCLDCHFSGFGSSESTPVCPNCKSDNVEKDPRTMNFDLNQLKKDSRGKDVPTHEIGHTLGYYHEHQNPNAGIVWNEDAVNDWASAPPNSWTKEEIDWNILSKVRRSDVEGSDWDPDSIMHYAFPKGLILEPEKYRNAPLIPAGGLSERDKLWAKSWYPLQTPDDYEPIQLDTPISLSMKPGEQKNFIFIPQETRIYDFQTIGESDTLLVLFEEKNNKRQQLAANDDSAEDFNAHIRQKLTKKNKYVLSVRLYHEWVEGDTTVKVW